MTTNSAPIVAPTATSALSVASSVSTPLKTAAPPLRVAFTGHAGSGKTTQAKLLQQKFKGDILSFASPLKKVTREIFEDRMDDGAFARVANQEVGVLARRLAGPDIWVNKLLAKVSENRNCYVDDVRFMSEVDALRRRGFVIIKLVAGMPALAARRPDMAPSHWAHESETSVDMLRTDLVVNTDGPTPEEAHAHIVAWLKERRLVR